MSKKLKIPKRVKAALDAGGDYSLRRGKRHIHIHVQGAFVAIAPHCVSGDGQAGGHGEANVIAQIRRARKGGTP